MLSVVIKSTNRAEIELAVKNTIDDLRKDHPEILRVFWFGSWVNGIPTPGSDVDLCLIVAESSLPRWERAASYLPVGFPVGLDLLVFTPEEFERVSEGLKREILRGREMLSS